MLDKLLPNDPFHNSVKVAIAKQSFQLSHLHALVRYHSPHSRRHFDGKGVRGGPQAYPSSLIRQYNNITD
jgi:hypothetical protein